MKKKESYFSLSASFDQLVQVFSKTLTHIVHFHYVGLTHPDLQPTHHGVHPG